MQNKILLIRGRKVILDADLAGLYGVQTRVLGQAVKRNIERFPPDFLFRLTKEEFDLLRSQTVISNKGGGRGGRGGRFGPRATSHGRRLFHHEEPALAKAGDTKDHEGLVGWADSAHAGS